MQEGAKSEQREGESEKQKGGWEEFGELEGNVNLRKAAWREKLFSSLSPTPSLPVPAVNQSNWSASDKRPPYPLHPTAESISTIQPIN